MNAYAIVNEFNNQTADHAIICGINDIRNMEVSFTIFNRPPRPYRPGETNPVLHEMKRGSLLDVAYWLDHQVHLDTLRQWIMYNEMLENFDASEYISAIALETFNEHQSIIIQPEVIKEINTKIGRLSKIIQDEKTMIHNIIGSTIKDSNRFQKHPPEN